MRIANLDGRLSLVVDGGTVDVEKASDGRFAADPALVYARWDEFVSWAGSAVLPAPEPLTDLTSLGPPSPRPPQVLAIGVNYRSHSEESGLAVPAEPIVFTKFPSCLAGPHGEVTLPAGGHTDWEVELVAVIGRTAFRADEAEAWHHVAGLTAGQDLSERVLQLAGAPPQFSIGKSYPGFGPTGPWLVTVDEFEDPDDLALGCSVNGDTVQQGRTRDLIFSVPQLIARLSAVLPLLPGDLIFTGTPSGVGFAMSPQRFLSPGDELTSYVQGIGELRQRFTE
jgi:2-keto-4-pentenoate hydratase/2-oxohepta-3-ene-1,7-dioic acid hydratase in catechol pathway